MARFAFDFVPLPEERSMEKPRTSGITMMIDKGETIEYLQGLLRMSGPFIDLGKIAVGTSRLYLEDYYREKLDLFKSHDIKPFIGGQFLEFIFATQGWGGVQPYFEAAAEYGVEAIEVSDNCVSLSDNERERMVALGRRRGPRGARRGGLQDRQAGHSGVNLTGRHICLWRREPR